MACKQGDVVLIPFPFTDFSTLKQRPAVIISSDAFNRSHSDAIIMAITSHLPAKSSKEDIILDNSAQKSAGLPKVSLIKVGKIVTIDQRLIRRKLGHLPAYILKIIRTRIQGIFA